MTSKMKDTTGEMLNIRFNKKIKLEFHGARLTFDGGLLAYRELDDALELFNSASTVMSDKRTGRLLGIRDAVLWQKWSGTWEICSRE